MGEKAQSISWTDLFSWNGIGWNVALLIGVWGALMGIGHYLLADLFFILAIVLFCVKWGHVTNILNVKRRVRLFSAGILSALALTCATLIWTSKQANAAEQDRQKLSRLDLIPELQQQIDALKAQNLNATAAISKKEETIEGLAGIVIQQQKTNADSAHRDLAQTATAISGQVQKSESVLSTNIDKYRTDTSSAVGKLLRPPRTLGGQRTYLLDVLKKAGPHQVAITIARGNQEALDFGNEIEKVFSDAGWTIAKSQFTFITKDGTGLGMWAKGETLPLRPDQFAVATAFLAIGMKLNGIYTPELRDDGPVELYVGLQ